MAHGERLAKLNLVERLCGLESAHQLKDVQVLITSDALGAAGRVEILPLPPVPLSNRFPPVYA